VKARDELNTLLWNHGIWQASTCSFEENKALLVAFR